MHGHHASAAARGRAGAPAPPGGGGPRRGSAPRRRSPPAPRAGRSGRRAAPGGARCPGSTRAACSTVSPGRRRRPGSRSTARRENAEPGSPWEPVATTMTRSRGSAGSSRAGRTRPSGSPRPPRRLWTSSDSTRPRPTGTTSRPVWAAARASWRKRPSCEANETAITAPRTLRTCSSIASATVASDGGSASTSALVESRRSRSVPASPQAASASCEVVSPRADGASRRSVASTRAPSAPSRRSATVPGIECETGSAWTANGPACTGLPGCSSRVASAVAVGGGAARPHQGRAARRPSRSRDTPRAGTRSP